MTERLAAKLAEQEDAERELRRVLAELDAKREATVAQINGTIGAAKALRELMNEPE